MNDETRAWVEGLTPGELTAQDRGKLRALRQVHGHLPGVQELIGRAYGDPPPPVVVPRVESPAWKQEQEAKRKKAQDSYAAGVERAATHPSSRRHRISADGHLITTTTTD